MPNHASCSQTGLNRSQSPLASLDASFPGYWLRRDLNLCMHMPHTHTYTHLIFYCSVTSPPYPPKTNQTKLNQTETKNFCNKVWRDAPAPAKESSCSVWPADRPWRNRARRPRSLCSRTLLWSSFWLFLAEQRYASMFIYIRKRHAPLEPEGDWIRYESGSSRWLLGVRKVSPATCVRVSANK